MDDLQLLYDSQGFVEQVYANRYVDVRRDAAFKLIFGKKENKPLLISLLNEIISDFTINDITYEDKEMISGPRAKRSLFDIYCTTDEGVSLIVEMQLEMTGDIMNRMLYYSSFPIMEQIGSGKKNYDLKLVYVITFCNFALNHESGWEEVSDGIISRYSIREDNNGELMTSSLRFIFVELGRLRFEERDIITLRDMWLYSLKHMHELQRKPETFKYEIMDRFYTASEFLALPREERHDYIYELKKEMDAKSLRYEYEKRGTEAGMKKGMEAGMQKGMEAGMQKGMEEGMQKGMEAGMQKGMEEGMKEGMKEGTKAVARNLLKEGFDIPTISRLTKLAEGEILSL